jgi:hypothetical protein
MDATIKLYCPLCRSELCLTDAVRTHLIGEHKRSAAEAAELIARFDIGKAIPEPDPEPHMYFGAKESRGHRRQGHAAAQAHRQMRVN